MKFNILNGDNTVNEVSAFYLIEIFDFYVQG